MQDAHEEPLVDVFDRSPLEPAIKYQKKHNFKSNGKRATYNYKDEPEPQMQNNSRSFD